MTHTLRFLGTGASSGVPSFYCGCKACEEALANPAARRSCASLLIKGTQNTLIDAAPDLRMQLSFAKAKDVAQVLLTHEHFDHIGGIPQLEFYVRLKTKKPVALYAGSHTLAQIAEQFAFMKAELEPHEIKAWQTLAFDGVRYTALPATHGTETFGYLIEGSKRRIAYFPDTGPLCHETAAALKGIDVLIIDATYHGNNPKASGHLSVSEAIKQAEKLNAKKTFLTHLAMHYDEPITARELQDLLAPYKGKILAANDGLEIPF
ncbi:MAG: MBL fold metallo-hydrolase [Coriobacteriia bacterium]|nr:MBL fold metallo-hydrolase [Coriobacteriia bacterium]